MNKSRNNQNTFKVVLLAVLAVLLVVMVLWVLMSGSRDTEITPETEPAAVQTEAPTEIVMTDATEWVEETEEAELETIPEIVAPPAGSLTYGEYLDLDVEMQQAYYNGFENADAFFVWLSDAKAEHEAATEATSDVSTEETSVIIIVDEGVEDWE